MSVIKVENLTKHFGNFIAVNNITFQVEKGEIFGFLGVNGARKIYHRADINYIYKNHYSVKN